ncbi:MAG: preprotein translocase subunit SecE [Desulfurivibrio sp.]|nr:preprotein translocase subunit SecE [Desulfurivibrio sp.]
MAAKVETGKNRPPPPGDESFGAKLTRLKQFIAEVRQEFGKVVWPGKKQTIMSTAVVVVLVSLIAAYLGIVDLVLGKLVGFILR